MIGNSQRAGRYASKLGQLPLALLLLCLMAAFPAPAAADNLALDFTGGLQAGCVASSCTAGWSFATTDSFNVTALGLFDESTLTAVGLAEAHEVGLWDAGMNLLATATVDNSSTVVASTSSDGRWLFTSISPVTLAAGNTYFVGAFYGSPSGDPFLCCPSTTATPTSGVAYLGAQFVYSNALTFPGVAFPTDNDGYFGPNLLLERVEVKPVPEPATLLLLGSGFAGLLGAGRRKRLG